MFPLLSLPPSKLLLSIPFFKLIYLVWLRCVLLSCGMRDLLVAACGLLSCGMHAGSSSPTREWTQAPCIGNAESYPLDHQGSPSILKLKVRLMFEKEGWIKIYEEGRNGRGIFKIYPIFYSILIFISRGKVRLLSVVLYYNFITLLLCIVSKSHDSCFWFPVFSNPDSLLLQSQITLMDIPVFKAIQPEVCTLSFTLCY